MVHKIQEWSSHRGYLSYAKKWDWLHKDFILSIISKDRAKRINRYRQFVSRETPEEINQILARKKLPPVIGSKGFVDRIKKIYFGMKRHGEVPEAGILAPEINRIKEEVCKLYGVNKSNLFVSRRGYFNEPRNVAIYLVRGVRGERLKDIGQEFGIEKYSTVSSIVKKIKGEMVRNRNLKSRVEKLNIVLSKSQTKT